MSKKRRQYRVGAASTYNLTVDVVKEGKKAFPGSIVDLSGGGMGVFFRERQGPKLVLKEAVLLRISSEYLTETLVAPSLVRRLDKVKGGMVYGFEFIDVLGLMAQLPPKLAKLFNQRFGYRVEPYPRRPIKVVIEGLPFKVVASMEDISLMGLSIHVPSNLETLFADCEEMEVSFELPDSGNLTFWGHVIHQSLTEKGICYGIFFDENRTPGFKKKRNLVAKFINHRRQEILGLPVQ